MQNPLIFLLNLLFIYARISKIAKEGITVRTLLTIIFVLVCIALTVVVLAQEGKDAGLGSLAGTSGSYWEKNKSRSMEGNLVKFTKGLAVAFIVLAIVLNLRFF